ncbi:MAG: hypothetical protein IJA60_01775 [Clostridia bacterium]|nr:hypothetical protein [Clostridia bacterium]
MNNKCSNCINLPEGTFCSATYCGDCRWLDLTDYTKSMPPYYYCKRIGSYKDPHTNTSCSHWEER